jgi:uncharacterized protein (TIGR02284 family)
MIETANKKLVSILNDLIKTNHDRITGYEKAANEIRNVDYVLESTFHRMAQDSQRFAEELSDRVIELGGQPSRGTTNSGKIYRVWLDVKGIFSGHEAYTVLENCEFGEDAAKKTYKLALESDTDWDATTRRLILMQQSILRAAHDTIKRLKESSKVKD